MITLYGLRGPNVAKTRASLLYKHLQFEHVSVDLVHKSDEFLNLTPIGRIPLIFDEGIIVHDSLFIAEYLDRKYPDAPILLPQLLEERVRAYTIFGLLERMFTIAAPLVAQRLGFFMLLDHTAAACSGYYPINAELALNLEGQLRRYLISLFRMFGGPEYFTGQCPTQADFAVFAFLSLLVEIEISPDPLSGWFERRKLEFPFNEMFATEETAFKRSI